MTPKATPSRITQPKPTQPMTTQRRQVLPEQLQTAAAREAITQAAEILRAGGTVAFPTETVYGLGANALDAASVAKIFTAKQRPAWDPLIVHVTDAEMLGRVVVPGAASSEVAVQRLMHSFWPGPLTLLLPRHSALPLEVTAGRELVGVRMPAHPVAQALIAACGFPIAAPSANRFGHISPTTAAHVLEDLDGRIDMVLDGGATTHGLESTVLELRDGGAIVYRPGAISIESLQMVLGSILSGPIKMYAQGEVAVQAVFAEKPEALPSPGVGIRHYAPRARLVLVETEFLSAQEREQVWLQRVEQAQKMFPVCGVILPEGWPLPLGFEGPRFDWGDWSNAEELAHQLYAGLRALDALSASCIVCPVPRATGMGAAIRDRLLKAAREK